MTRNRNNQSLKRLISFVLVVILLSTIQPLSGQTDWSDDFPVDGAPNDWEFYAYERGDGGGGGPHIPVSDDNLHIRVRNGVLMAPHYNDLPYGYNFAIRSEAYHNSTQAYGTWSFDWITSAEVERTHGAIIDLSFIISSENDLWNMSGLSSQEWIADKTVYGLTLVSRTKAHLGAGLGWKAAAPGISLVIIEKGLFEYVDIHEFEQNIEGTHHIEIQRIETGEINVSYDQDLILNYIPNNQSFGHVAESEKFAYSSIIGDSGIDNLEISSIIDPPTTITTDSTTTSTQLNATGNSSNTSNSTWQYIIAGSLSGAIVIAIFWNSGKKKF
ncbi:MAG: hypothetical protein ACW99A_03950 [Candidatus Kariarchaeaceae archaeon]